MPVFTSASAAGLPCGNCMTCCDVAYTGGFAAASQHSKSGQNKTGCCQGQGPGFLKVCFWGGVETEVFGEVTYEVIEGGER
jgi:hypothetical protein